MKQENCYLMVSRMWCYPYTAQARPWTDSLGKSYGSECDMYLEPKNDFHESNTSSASLLHVLMSLRC